MTASLHTLLAVPESQRCGSLAASDAQKSRKSAQDGTALTSDALALRSVVGSHTDGPRLVATTIDEYFQPLAPRFSQNLLFACLRAADDVFEKSGVPPGEDPETRQLRERLADVEQERDRLEAALSSATDARGRLERELRQAREEAAARSDAESKAQAERIATLEERCEELQHQLEEGQAILEE